MAHSVNVLVASLTRLGESDSVVNDPTKLLMICSSVECLLLALLGESILAAYLKLSNGLLIRGAVKPRLGEYSSVISDPIPLIRQLLRFIETARSMSTNGTPYSNTEKLICNSFAVLMEASVRDDRFWNAVKKLAQLDRLVSALLLQDSRHLVRNGIAQHMAIVCGVSDAAPKKPIEQTEDTPMMSAESSPVAFDMLATMWGAFVKSFPETMGYAQQCQEFFEVALAIFRSVAEKSPQDLVFNDYLREWSCITLKHQTDEVGPFIYIYIYIMIYLLC